jgi:hypothetical protein
MADITNSTGNVTVFGGDNPALAKAVTSTTDGAKERLDVAGVFPYPTDGTPIHAYNFDSDLDVGDVGATHTVATGKVFYVYHWHISDESYGWYQLQINGTTKDMIINNDSGSGQVGLNSVTYPIPLKATAGQVVRIYKYSGLSNKEVASLICGIEVNV